MPPIILIADSGSTKTEWCLVSNGKKRKFITQGMSPYFIGQEQMEHIISTELVPRLSQSTIDQIFYYGTGCRNKENARIVNRALKKMFPSTNISIDHDLMAAAKALCGDDKGIACILGTGSNSCYYNGKRIVRNSPGLGFILGDEGSGAHLGKMVIRHYLYKIFDKQLKGKFDAKFSITEEEILTAVYKKPLPNRYLASFAIFLAENRGHYMIENIISDGLNDFFFNHIITYKEINSLRVHFVGSIAVGFKDVISALCNDYNLELGNVMKNTMDGLVKYHSLKQVSVK